jgi:hypothetical protein
MRLSSRFALSAAVISIVSISNFAAPPEGVLDGTHASVRAIINVQNAATPDLMKIPGILGTATGVSDAGNLSFVIYVDQKKAGVAASLPPNWRGVPVQVEITDAFRAWGKPGGVGGGGGGTQVSHTAAQTPPIQLGTSGGWRYDLANGYCCGGTLGSLVQVNGVQFILSNYHVFESDIVLGGNSIVAVTGNPIIQPGLIDVNCNPAGSVNIGTLHRVQSLPTYNVDVGLAEAAPGMVRSDGAILEIGTISKFTLAPALNKAVKKSGRTSGLTRAKITGLNATISVAYDNECAGGAAFTHVFTGQVVISNKGSSFLKAGDSGSLMVEDVATNPRAVGLLYAGSSSSAIANPIDEVLAFVGQAIGGAGTSATMVGN